MAGPSFRPFVESDLDAGAALLAARHRRDGTRFHGLPGRTEAEARGYLAAAARGARGLIAEDGSGFLLATVAETSVRGRHAWVEVAGHAVAGDPELYRDLYAAAAPGWVDEGALDHYVVVPADPAVLDAWFRLGFGLQQVHAWLPLDLIDAPRPTTVTIRRAHPGDRDLLVATARLIADHQRYAPTFAHNVLPDDRDLHTIFAAELADPSNVHWLALDGTAALGFAAFCPAEPGLQVPPGAVELARAATRPEARGRGIGRALTEHGLAAARDAGASAALTDWRVPNLLSSRFWPRRGFTPLAYRLHRALDPRIRDTRPRS